LISVSVSVSVIVVNVNVVVPNVDVNVVVSNVDVNVVAVMTITTSIVQLHVTLVYLIFKKLIPINCNCGVVDDYDTNHY